MLVNLTLHKEIKISTEKSGNQENQENQELIWSSDGCLIVNISVHSMVKR